MLLAPRPRSRNTGREHVNPVPALKCDASGHQSQALHRVSGESSNFLSIGFAFVFWRFPVRASIIARRAGIRTPLFSPVALHLPGYGVPTFPHFLARSHSAAAQFTISGLSIAGAPRGPDGLHISLSGLSGYGGRDPIFRQLTRLINQCHRWRPFNWAQRESATSAPVCIYTVQQPHLVFSR